MWKSRMSIEKAKMRQIQTFFAESLLLTLTCKVSLCIILKTCSNENYIEKKLERKKGKI